MLVLNELVGVILVIEVRAWCLSCYCCGRAFLLVMVLADHQARDERCEGSWSCPFRGSPCERGHGTAVARDCAPGRVHFVDVFVKGSCSSWWLIVYHAHGDRVVRSLGRVHLLVVLVNEVHGLVLVMLVQVVMGSRSCLFLGRPREQGLGPGTRHARVNARGGGILLVLMLTRHHARGERACRGF